MTREEFIQELEDLVKDIDKQNEYSEPNELIYNNKKITTEPAYAFQGMQFLVNIYKEKNNI